MVYMRLELATNIVNDRIDHEKGAIFGVSVISEGPALGHGMFCDAKTLQSVKECAETYRGGLKVKMEHHTDAKDIVGSLRNFRISGTQLRADLHLLKKSPHYGHIIEMAEVMPDGFGLSIAFSCETEELPVTLSTGETGVRKFARCVEIYSADVVDQPAANPTGLFSEIDNSKQTMTETQAPEVAKTEEVGLAKAGAEVEAKEEQVAMERLIADLLKENEVLKAKIEELSVPKVYEPRVELAAKTVEFASKSEVEALKCEIAALRKEFVDAGKLAARQVASLGIPAVAAPQVAVDTGEAVADPKAAARKRAAAALAAIKFN